MSDERPVLFVTGNAPPSRVEPFRLLAESEQVVFALFGGSARHALGGEEGDLPFPHLRPSQREVRSLAASGRYRAVVCGTGGRIALPAAYVGARRARVPFVLWSSLWAHPLSLAGIAGYPPLRHVYRHADAVATYGPHVSRYVRAKGATCVFEAPQAVDNSFWSAPATGRPEELAGVEGTTFLFIGRPAREKGSRVLLEAWRKSGLEAPHAAMVLVGCGPERARAAAARAVVAVFDRPPAILRNFYAAADVLVVPSIPTATFHEPWGLVVNEAMNQGLPIIASDAVGAAAGGLVRHERNGLVVPAGDAGALAGAMLRLQREPDLRRRLGDAGREDVRRHTFDAWASGISRALAAATAARKD